LISFSQFLSATVSQNSPELALTPSSIL
jgi:hypothetical protein